MAYLQEEGPPDQEGTKREDRYLCGPRLEARLTARAEAAVERCKPGWLSRLDGVERLMTWLERRCSRQAVPDVGQELDTFLNKTTRRKLEPMQQWTDRFETGYQYLRCALARAGTVSSSAEPHVEDLEAVQAMEMGRARGGP